MNNNITILSAELKAQQDEESKNEKLQDIYVKLSLPENKDQKGVLENIKVHVFGYNFNMEDVN